MRKAKHFLLLPFILFYINGIAQVKTNFNNPERVGADGKFSMNYSPAIFEISPPDLTNALTRDKAEAAAGSKLLYIAEPVPVNISVGKSASWVTAEKFAHGKFTVRAKGAQTLSINFSNFHLPKGTEMYIYNKAAEMITGVITDAENNEGKVWGSSIYKGDEVNIEIKIPAGVKDELSLQLTNVAYGYKQIFIDKTAGFGASGACNINVLCPEGTPWAEERNSVVYIAHATGAALCSGAMLMNTCSTTTPYVLTANHCFVADNNTGGWRTHFQAWSATCTPNQNSDGILFNGSTLRANWDQSDFCLVQLNNTPAANSGIRYAGWSRATAAATSGAGIHHPSGDVMKISTYAATLVREDDPVRCGINAVGVLHWVVQWNQGVTEGGSSGSPLFDQNHRIVGQLSGGPSSCAQPANCRMDMYGRFDNSWTGGGTNATRLSNWLDPTNSGTLTTNTTNVSALAAPVTQTLTNITGVAQICGSSTYGTNLTAGTNVTWSVTQPGSSLSCTNCPQTILTLAPATSEWLTATYGCPAQTVTLPVKEVNYGANSFSTSGIHIWCRNQTSSVSVNTATYPGLTNFVWGNPPLNWTKVTGGTPGSYIVLRSGSTTSPPTGTITVTATNACGNIASSSHFMVVSSMSGCGVMRISPNPASDVINVELVDEATGETAALSEIKAVELVDKTGMLVYRQKLTGKSLAKVLKIPVKDLKNDIYTLRITDGAEWKSFKVIVAH